jgi:hypothetical protein
LFITLALVVTLGFLVFGRDVSRSAHGAGGPLRSEDKSFGAITNALISSENHFDGRLHRLLSQGATLKRYVFAARLTQLDEELSNWSVAASQVSRPVLAHDINDTLSDVTQTRVEDYEVLLADVARSLHLPWSSPSPAVSGNPATALEAASAQWNKARFALVKEPGGVHLDKTSSMSAHYFAANGASALVHSTTLALARAIGIGAVRVSPAPLPSNPGTLLLPPVTQIQLGVSVVNKSYDLQPVTLTIRVTPANKQRAPFTQTLKATIGPLAAYAFVPNAIATASSERARVVVVVTGAPAATGMVTHEAYELETSPSGVTTTIG